MADLILYGRAQCELCDIAEALLHQVSPEHVLRLQKIDIDSDAELRERYALSIPVLRCAIDGRELRWPFPPSRLREFLAA
ncbi:MAG: glutaredoxin family protein [Pseudomonadales bacterium]